MFVSVFFCLTRVLMWYGLQTGPKPNYQKKFLTKSCSGPHLCKTSRLVAASLLPTNSLQLVREMYFRDSQNYWGRKYYTVDERDNFYILIPISLVEPAWLWYSPSTIHIHFLRYELEKRLRSVYLIIEMSLFQSFWLRSRSTSFSASCFPCVQLTHIFHISCLYLL